MRDFVPEHAGQLCLVIHQADQLPGRINISTGNSEGIIDRAVEQRDCETVLRISQPRLNRDILADTFNIACLRAGHRAAEFSQQLRMVLCALCRFIVRNRS